MTTTDDERPQTKPFAQFLREHAVEQMALRLAESFPQTYVGRPR